MLQGLLEGAWRPEQVQAWASFVRRGYIAGPNSGSVRPIEVNYEIAYEDRIVEAVARLDEIGDRVDGEVSSNEILDLLRRLDEPDTN